ncbi:hypothetical protein D9M68_664220 [compost metagenome]
MALDLKADLGHPVEAHYRQHICHCPDVLDAGDAFPGILRGNDEVLFREQPVTNDVICVHQRVAGYDQIQVSPQQGFPLLRTQACPNRKLGNLTQEMLGEDRAAGGSE